MASKNSPLNYRSLDLEKEVIRRFRALVPFLSPKCRVFRELNGRSSVLCLDFADCPQELQMSKKEWQEFALLLALSCHYLGLASSLVFRNGKRVLGWMTLDQIA